MWTVVLIVVLTLIVAGVLLWAIWPARTGAVAAGRPAMTDSSPAPQIRTTVHPRVSASDRTRARALRQKRERGWGLLPRMESASPRAESRRLRTGEAEVACRAYAPRVARAMEGFLDYDCDEDLAARLRREVEEAQGKGYDHFEFNTFDVELFYGEDRVQVREAVPLGFDDEDVTIAEFLAALPEVAPGARMHGRPRRVIVPPPPTD